MAKRDARPANEIAPTSRDDWRAWLRANHRRTPEVWLVFLKGLGGKNGLTYEESIEEALCFGWVDSLIKRIDGDRYARKFTPRRPGSIWSELNKRRVRDLIKRRRMTAAGLAAFEAPSRPANRVSPKSVALDPPDDLVKALEKDAVAKQNFERFPPSAKRLYLSWIANAKKAATRARRIDEAVRRIANGEKTLLK